MAVVQDAESAKVDPTTIGDMTRIADASRALLAMVEENPVTFTPPQPTSVREQGTSETPVEPGVSSNTLPAAVLVADDDAVNREVLGRMLRRLGHTVIFAENGRLALELLARERIDMVLLDVMMPELDGYQVLEARRASQPLRDIPVVVISGYDDGESVSRCIELGAEDYLPKPFDVVLLQARLSACLEKKRWRDQELAYLKMVSEVAAAAVAVEQKTFQPGMIAHVAARTDELGQLARAVRHMANEVAAREERLAQQVRRLTVEVDEARKARQVEEITNSEYFQSLQQRARSLRSRHAPADHTRPSSDPEQ